MQCVMVCCSVLPRVAVCTKQWVHVSANCVCKCVATVSVSQCVAICCSVLPCVAVCCSVLQCVAMCTKQFGKLSKL